MSARKVIEWTMKSFGAFDPTRETDAVLVALHAADYRILGPGELDAETLERVAEFTQNEFQRDFESPVGWRGQFVAAIRSLAGSKDKEGRRE